jgi:hypothetical protein
MKIAFIYEEPFNWVTGAHLLRACRRLGIACEHYSVAASQNLRPGSHQLYFRIDSGDCSGPDLPTRLRPAIFYAIDTHLAHSLKHVRRIAPRYDRVFCCHRDAQARLAAEWLPVACDPELSNPQPHAPQRDFAFVGNDGGIPRKFILQALRERYPNSFCGIAPVEALIPTYRAAKIGFNYAIRNEINLRQFEVMGAGTLLINNPVPRADLQALGMKEGQHLVIYHHPRELFPCIDYWLGHPTERQAIAQAARELILRNHTYVHRMLQVLASCNQHLGCSFPLPKPPEAGSMTASI